MLGIGSEMSGVHAACVSGATDRPADPADSDFDSKTHPSLREFEMAEKNIQPVQPAADTAKAEDAKTGEQRKSAAAKFGRKIASVRFGRKTNQCKF
jgi:hypothetical protein